MPGALLALLLAADVTPVERRIEGVVNGLLSSSAFSGRFGSKATLQQRMAYYHTPGVSIAVINDGRVEWARGFGVKEQGKPAPVTERTLFQAGSISKPIFAMAVMRLVQDKKLSLDEDVNRYLTSWQVPANGSWQPRLTLRQLLTHSAGLTVHGFPGYGTNEKLPTLVDVLEGRPPANTARVEVNILPDLQLRYSGGGTTVAQLAVMDHVGKPFPQILRETLLDPIGMADSTYEQPLPAARAREAATAHPWKGRTLPGRWHVYPEMAAAGLWTTAGDLARAGVEMLKALKGESRVLEAETAKQMLTPQVGDEIGIGFFLEGKAEDVRFGHGGWDEGFVAEMTVYKQKGMGAVVMVNSNEGQPLLREIQRAIAKEYGWPGYFREDKKKAAASDAILESYVGPYAAKSGTRFAVTKSEGGLRLAVGDQPPVDLLPESETSFYTTTVNAEVVFTAVDKGKPAMLSVNQAGNQTTAEKVELPPSEETAKAALEKSPRHGEWADVPLPGGSTLRAWVVYPERKDKAPVVLVIHEIYGLSDWIRGVADRLAGDGFIAVAPDFLSGKGAKGGGSESFESRDELTKAIRALAPEDVNARLDAARQYAIRLPAANGKSATIGFCWGGARSFGYATAQPALDAAVVYYGSNSAEPEVLARIKAPVLGLYGGDDARVNATIEPAAAELKKLGKTYEYQLYEGAGHGFLRAQEGRDGANRRASLAAWPKTIAFLREKTDSSRP